MGGGGGGDCHQSESSWHPIGGGSGPVVTISKSQYCIHTVFRRLQLAKEVLTTLKQNVKKSDGLMLYCTVLPTKPKGQPARTSIAPSIPHSLRHSSLHNARPHIMATYSSAKWLACSLPRPGGNNCVRDHEGRRWTRPIQCLYDSERELPASLE